MQLQPLILKNIITIFIPIEFEQTNTKTDINRCINTTSPD